MKRILSITVTATAAMTSLALMAGCSTAPSRPATAAVGPLGASGQPGRVNGRGSLIVYTAEKSIDDGDVYYSPHTGYGLFNTDGKLIRMVPNHVGNWDETPMVVQLDAGTYFVEGRAEGMGRVTVPVLIDRNRLTVVNLTHQGLADGQLLPESERVHLADGRIIGRRAPFAASRAAP